MPCSSSGSATRCENTSREAPADDGRDLHESARRLRQLVDPREQQALERNGQEPIRRPGERPRAATTLEATVLDERTEQLLEIQRVPFCTGDDLRARRGVETVGQEHGEQVGRLVVPERLQRQVRRPMGIVLQGVQAEARAFRGRLSTEADREQERRPFGELEQALRELAGRCVSPLEVVDRDHDGLAGGQRTEPVAIGVSNLDPEVVDRCGILARRRGARGALRAWSRRV